MFVYAIFNTKDNTLSVTELSTGRTANATNVFTGGASSSTSITYGNDRNQVPIDKGSYSITAHVNPKKGQEDWFSLLRDDGKTDDYYTNDEGENRSGMRLHGGGTSHGCVTVSTVIPGGGDA